MFLWFVYLHTKHTKRHEMVFSNNHTVPVADGAHPTAFSRYLLHCATGRRITRSLCLRHALHFLQRSTPNVFPSLRWLVLQQLCHGLTSSAGCCFVVVVATKSVKSEIVVDIITTRSECKLVKLLATVACHTGRDYSQRVINKTTKKQTSK